MLILTRRVGETIFITLPPNRSENEVEVTITVLGVKGNQVRLGTNAPKDVHVDREEVHQRKKLERAEDNAKRQIRNQRRQASDRSESQGGVGFLEV